MVKNLTYRNLDIIGFDSPSLSKNYDTVSDVIDLYREDEHVILLSNERSFIILSAKTLLIFEISAAQKNKIHTTRTIPIKNIHEVLLVYRSQSDLETNYSDVYINYHDISITLSFKKLTDAKSAYKEILTSI